MNLKSSVLFPNGRECDRAKKTLKPVSPKSWIFATPIYQSDISLKDKLIIGRKPVIDALNSDVELEKVWISASLKGEIEKDVRRLTREKKISLQYVPKEKLNSLVSRGSQHQGLAAQLSLVNYIEMEALLPFLYEQGRVPALVVLDGVEDVRNIGAIARSAVWFGIDAIIIGMKRTAMINSFAYKSSAGAIKDIPICRVMSITKAMQFLKDSGVRIAVAAGGEEENNNLLTDYKAVSYTHLTLPTIYSV